MGMIKDNSLIIPTETSKWNINPPTSDDESQKVESSDKCCFLSKNVGFSFFFNISDLNDCKLNIFGVCERDSD